MSHNIPFATLSVQIQAYFEVPIPRVFLKFRAYCYTISIAAYICIMKKLILFSFITVALILAITIGSYINDPSAGRGSIFADTTRILSLQEISDIITAVLAQIKVIQSQLAILMLTEKNPTPIVAPVASNSSTPSPSPLATPSSASQPLPTIYMSSKIDPVDTIIHEGDVLFANVTVSDTDNFSMSHNICTSGKVRFYFASNLNVDGIKVMYQNVVVGTVANEGYIGQQGTVITLPKNQAGACTYTLPLTLTGVRNPMPGNPNIKVSVAAVEFRGISDMVYPLYSTSKMSLNTVYFGQ